MEPEPQLQDVPLTADQAAALDAVIAQSVRAITGALARIERPAAAVCALGLGIGQDEGFDPPWLMLSLQPDRERVLREIAGGDEPSWEDVWNPMAAFLEDEAIEPPELEAPDAFHSSAQEVLDALEERVLDPPRWVFNRIARVLTSTSMPFPVTDDFVAFVIDDSFDGDLIREQLAFVASPETYERLVARGAVGATESDQYG